MTTQTLSRSSHAATASAHAPSTRGSEVRGFALYVGLDEIGLDPADPRLSAIVAQLKSLVAEVSPHAETYAALALAPEGLGGRDIDVVRLALGEPAARAKQRQEVDEEQDRAASGVQIDLSRKQVLLDNIAAPLTYREFELLQTLILREGRTVAREELISTLWPQADAEDAPNARTIDVHVRRLRVKLAQYQGIIRTVRGIGYRFDRHADVSITHRFAPSPDVL